MVYSNTRVVAHLLRFHLGFSLQAILRASLDHNSLSVEKFSRWLRATCSILLSRNTAPDRTRVINYIEQAITVLDEHGDMSGDDGEVRHVANPSLLSTHTLPASGIPHGRTLLAVDHGV